MDASPEPTWLGYVVGFICGAAAAYLVIGPPRDQMNWPDGIVTVRRDAYLVVCPERYKNCPTQWMLGLHSHQDALDRARKATGFVAEPKE